MAGILRGIGSRYMSLLKKHPMKVQSMSTGILMGTGDVIAQFVVEKKSIPQYEFERTARFLVFGTFIGGPILKTWYGTLDKIITSQSKWAIFPKVALDQLCFAPVFLTGFIVTITAWSTKSRKIAFERWKTDFIPILIANYKIWPSAQLVNFYFVPAQLRVLYVNSFALLWNTYLAWKTNSSSNDSESTNTTNAQEES